MRSVIRCSAVCKYWFSLINSPDYYHKRIGSQSESSLPCTFIFRYGKRLQIRNPLYQYLPEKSQILLCEMKSNDHYLSLLPGRMLAYFRHSRTCYCFHLMEILWNVLWYAIHLLGNKFCLPYYLGWSLERAF